MSFFPPGIKARQIIPSLHHETLVIPPLERYIVKISSHAVSRNFRLGFPHWLNVIDPDAVPSVSNSMGTPIYEAVPSCEYVCPFYCANDMDVKLAGLRNSRKRPVNVPIESYNPQDDENGDGLDQLSWPDLKLWGYKVASMDSQKASTSGTPYPKYRCTGGFYAGVLVSYKRCRGSDSLFIAYFQMEGRIDVPANAVRNMNRPYHKIPKLDQFKDHYKWGRETSPSVGDIAVATWLNVSFIIGIFYPSQTELTLEKKKKYTLILQRPNLDPFDIMKCVYFPPDTLCVGVQTFVDLREREWNLYCEECAKEIDLGAQTEGNGRNNEGRETFHFNSIVLEEEEEDEDE